MDTNFKVHVLLLGLTLQLSFSSCTKTCDEGYEGKRCDVAMRDKFLGRWNATDNPGNLTYIDSIFYVNSNTILEVYIAKNFGNYFQREIKAKVDGKTITINKQKPFGDSLYVQGTGVITDDFDTLYWNYYIINEIDSPVVTTSYTGVWTR